MTSALEVEEHFVHNGDGWLLHLTRSVNPSAFRADALPLVLIPGYGMNAFIFGFHPRGTSMVAALAAAGHEVWTANLRAQGASRRERPDAPGPSMRGFSDVDLPAAVDAVVARTRAEVKEVGLIGCSLGGTLAYAYAALRPEAPVARVIAVGSPLRWDEMHLAFKVLLRWPSLVGRVQLRGSRRFARALVPLAAKVPMSLGMYMNPAHVDLKALPTMVRTIEDPSPRVNEDIARWVKQRDLVIRGVNVTEGLAAQSAPLLVVASNRDGVVPDAAALCALDAWGGPSELLRVGTPKAWYAHADLFIGNNAPQDVFAPIAEWLAG